MKNKYRLIVFVWFIVMFFSGLILSLNVPMLWKILGIEWGTGFYEITYIVAGVIMFLFAMYSFFVIVYGFYLFCSRFKLDKVEAFGYLLYMLIPLVFVGLPLIFAFQNFSIPEFLYPTKNTDQRLVNTIVLDTGTDYSEDHFVGDIDSEFEFFANYPGAISQTYIVLPVTKGEHVFEFKDWEGEKKVVLFFSRPKTEGIVARGEGPLMGYLLYEKNGRGWKLREKNNSWYQLMGQTGSLNSFFKLEAIGNGTYGITELYTGLSGGMFETRLSVIIINPGQQKSESLFYVPIPGNISWGYVDNDLGYVGGYEFRSNGQKGFYDLIITTNGVQKDYSSGVLDDGTHKDNNRTRKLFLTFSGLTSELVLYEYISSQENIKRHNSGYCKQDNISKCVKALDKELNNKYQEMLSILPKNKTQDFIRDQKNWLEKVSGIDMYFLKPYEEMDAFNKVDALHERITYFEDVTRYYQEQTK